MSVVIPDEIVQATRMSEGELKQEIALMLFHQQKLTLGRASRLAGMSRLQFQHLLASRQIPVHYDVAEFEEDLKTLKISDQQIPFVFEPSCEQEVVAAFSVIATRLGFAILDLGTAFPDCRGRRIDTKTEVRIEFEYRSSDFVAHGHSPDACDIIVCWEQDVKLAQPEVIALKEFFPPLPPKSGRDDPKTNVHEIVVARASEPDGLPYPELTELLGKFHEKNVNEPIRCVARLFKWGCFPYSCNGRLKIRNQPVNKDYAVQQDEVLIGLGKELLKLLEEQWEASSRVSYSGG